MSKVLVTGASGYIASHVILQLLEAGNEVVGTLRSKSKVQMITGSLSEFTDKLQALSFVDLDLLDSYEKYLQVIEGCDYVMHLASPFPEVSPRDDSKIVLPAKNSIVNILKAASQTKVKRVVFISSIGAVAYGVRKSGKFDETDWTDETNLADTTAYFRSKTIAEKTAFKYIKNHDDVEFVSIAAGLVLGPLIYDWYGTSIGIIKSIMEGKYPTLPGVGYSVVDVRSVAALLVKSMTAPQASGQRYVATDSWVTFPQLSEILQTAFPDKKIQVGQMPNWMVKIAAIFSRELGQILNDIGTKREVVSQKASKDLGWESISVNQTVVDTALSLMDKGIVENE